MLSAYLIAWVAGIGSGFVAARLSIEGSRRFSDDRFWQRLREFARLLFSPDAADRLVAEYLKLWPALFWFAAKKLVVGLLSILPVVAAFGCLTLLCAPSATGPVDWMWPSVNDWEFQFFAAVCLASVASWLAAKYGPEIFPVDVSRWRLYRLSLRTRD